MRLGSKKRKKSVQWALVAEHVLHNKRGLLLRRSLLRSIMMKKEPSKGTNGGSEGLIKHSYAWMCKLLCSFCVRTCLHVWSKGEVWVLHVCSKK